MSKISCDACVELKENAPEFVMNGVTDTVCGSLMNDTGLNPGLTVLHNNCDDLHDVNDCLIGRMDNELEAYEVCDWKDYMHKLLPNMYELTKAIICGDCGQWNRIHWLDGRIGDLCNIFNTFIVNNLNACGILTGEQIKGAEERKGGEIILKEGVPTLIREDVDTDNNWNGVGVLYLKREHYDCSGVKKTYEWLQPYLRDYYYNDNVVNGDHIWRADVSTLKRWGFTDYLISELEKWPQWWDGFGSSWGDFSTSTLYLGINDGYLNMRRIGSTPNINRVTINSYVNKPKLYVS